MSKICIYVNYYVYRFERTLDKFSLVVYSLRFNKNSLTHFPRLTLIYIAQCKIKALYYLHPFLYWASRIDARIFTIIMDRVQLVWFDTVVSCLVCPYYWRNNIDCVYGLNKAKQWTIESLMEHAVIIYVYWKDKLVHTTIK